MLSADALTFGSLLLLGGPARSPSPARWSCSSTRSPGRSRTLAGADALTILIGTVAVGMPFVLTLCAQQVVGYPALKFGSYQPAFPAWAVLAGIGLALAFLLPGLPRKPAHELPEPDPAADVAAAGDAVIRSGTK
ncbi:hypothetical protein [Trebonia sp.]|uniref:hypothetical protein n=1 Tax=Trebonia sp. TaxID=2767075 RepID=UPI00262433B5|nr:hypothetical protein [Trebonia sp.]